jgi:death-on-curing protein
MTLQIRYFDLTHAVREHDWIIEHSGGAPGAHNLGLIDSILAHIQNDIYYSTFEQKLVHLVFAVNKSHAFVDGNKRSSIALGAYFLEINGYGYCVKDFVGRMENIAVEVAKNTIDKMLLGEIIESILYEPDYSEVLKLKIIAVTTSVV